MGNSTKSLASIFDVIAGRGIPDPRQGASGYGTQVALDIATRTMAEIIKERFNWKWNRATATPFLTNSFQQDYPQIGLSTLDWLEDADRLEINSTAYPKPLRGLTVRKQISRCGITYSPTFEICWMYNNQLSYGTWPGAGVTFYPLIATNTQQNPLMSMIDANGNLLIVTHTGVTGNSAPAAPANSAEGVTVSDGSVVWTVVSPTNVGFRIYGLPSATGPIYQITPYYQKKAVSFSNLQAVIDPIPDNFAQYFQNGCEAFCLEASNDPTLRDRFKAKYGEWLQSLVDVKRQGDRESDAYSMLPACQPIETVYAWQRDPRDPSDPY